MQMMLDNQLPNKQASQLKEGGFVALASVLVIAAIVLVLGISVSLLSINEIQTSFSSNKAARVLYLVEACAEEALLELNEDNTITSPIVLPEITCSATINAQTGSSWDFTISGTFDEYTQQIQVQAERTTSITVTSWEQI
jgi:hypothetical protein